MQKIFFYFLRYLYKSIFILFIHYIMLYWRKKKREKELKQHFWRIDLNQEKHHFLKKSRPRTNFFTRFKIYANFTQNVFFRTPKYFGTECFFRTPYFKTFFSTECFFLKWVQNAFLIFKTYDKKYIEHYFRLNFV